MTFVKTNWVKELLTGLICSRRDRSTKSGGSDFLMFETINRIKGLEVPILFFTNFVSPIEIEKLYVGLSRAKNRLFIIGLDSKIEELKKKLG